MAARGTTGMFVLGFCAAAVMLLPIGSATAAPKPDVAAEKAKLEKLNKQVDQLVERYNAVHEDWKTAKAKVDKLNTRLTGSQNQVDRLRDEAAGVAVAAYQGGDLMTMPMFISSGDPQIVLHRASSLSHLAAGQALIIGAHQNAATSVEQQRNVAKTSMDELTKAETALKGERSKVETAIKDQVKLLRRLGVYVTGSPQGAGKKYTGPATGNARAALEFAYAQLGKPYKYGGEGPDAYDCSGFTQASWRAGGVAIPRTTNQQWAWGADRRVDINAMQPGDIIFDKGLGHVALYAGSNKVVDAPHTGAVIREQSLDGYGRGRILGAVRP